MKPDVHLVPQSRIGMPIPSSAGAYTVPCWLWNQAPSKTVRRTVSCIPHCIRGNHHQGALRQARQSKQTPDGTAHHPPRPSTSVDDEHIHARTLPLNAPIATSYFRLIVPVRPGQAPGAAPRARPYPALRHDAERSRGRPAPGRSAGCRRQVLRKVSLSVIKMVCS